MPAGLSGREHDPPLACPWCRQPLTDTGDRLLCGPCPRTYPVVAGIPDLRVRPDRYLDLEEDRRKARELAALDHLGFEELVEAYWSRTPEVPAELAARYARTARAGTRRGEAVLDRLGVPGPGDRVLDVGCGTGGLVEAAARRGAAAVGVDVALRWLVVARRRLDEAGLTARLVAADGAVLPFPSASFDLTTCIETLEHTADQRGLLQSCLLSVGPGGTGYLVTANRFSLAPEPTVGLWGVGYLPRSWATAYVRRRRATRYQFFRAVSAGELRAMAGPTSQVRIGPAPLPPPGDQASGAERAVRQAYERLRASAPARPPLAAVAPFIELHRRPS